AKNSGIDNPAWNCTALMLITPPRWLQSDSSIHPARRRSCDWRLKVRANQEIFSPKCDLN
ncbi:hypothetical protein, partial [Xanthomonas axonopodis]|uniref:hypothetical protein n=1 Tax=Xanthomonas axonopodis TaxID=53413 RepID=UPI001C4E1C9F